MRMREDFYECSVCCCGNKTVFHRCRSANQQSGLHDAYCLSDWEKDNSKSCERIWVDRLRARNRSTRFRVPNGRGWLILHILYVSSYRLRASKFGTKNHHEYRKVRRLGSWAAITGGRRTHPPEILFGGRKRKRPPIIAPCSNFLITFFHFDYCISILFPHI